MTLARRFPTPLIFAAGLTLLALKPKSSPTPTPAPPPTGGAAKPATKPSKPQPVTPAIPDSAPCSFFLDLHGPGGEVTTLADNWVFNGLRSQAAEAEHEARGLVLPSGPPGSRWVLIGVCKVGGEDVSYEAATIKTFAGNDG